MFGIIATCCSLDSLKVSSNDAPHDALYARLIARTMGQTLLGQAASLLMIDIEYSLWHVDQSVALECRRLLQGNQTMQ